MNTIEILYKLFDLSEKNPHALTKEIWDDVRRCIDEELKNREELYSAEQYGKITGRVELLTGRLVSLSSIGEKQGIQNDLSELIGLADSLPDMDFHEPFMEKYHFNAEYVRHRQSKTIIVMGDSHVNFFSGNELLDFTPIGNSINLCKSVNNLPFTVLHLGPALAYTCMKPDSSMRFHEKAQFLLENFITPGAKIIVSLGEIDIRVHALSHAEKDGKPIEEIIDDILSRYMEFLISLKKRGYEVYCWGPVASQLDDTPQDPMCPRYGSETDRNKATAIFNNKLSELCEKNGMGFLSIFQNLVSDDMCTKSQYLSSDLFHLSQKAMEYAIPVFKATGLMN